MLEKRGGISYQTQKNVVDIVLQRTIASWEIETTCKDIWNLIEYFEVVNVMHIPRSWNLVAHNLAKFSIC